MLNKFHTRRSLADASHPHQDSDVEECQPYPETRDPAIRSTRQTLQRSSSKNNKSKCNPSTLNHSTAGKNQNKGRIITDECETTQRIRDNKIDDPRRPLPNKDFEELEQTGQWGHVSKMEIILVSIMILIISVAVTGTVIVLAGKNNSNRNPNHGNDGDNYFPPIPPVPNSPILTPSQQMNLIQSALEENDLTRGVWDEYGDSVVANPYRLAAEWVVEQDSVDTEKDILPRFALATIYYVTGGNAWNHTKGWLTDLGVCDGWYGINCNESGDIIEVALRGNNLTGKVPVALTFLKMLQVLRMDNNRLEGPLPADVFNSLRKLQFLYIQNNQLTGPIPSTLLQNGGFLRTFFIQGNHFVGNFPDVYCPTTPEDEHPLLAFALNCSMNPCTVPKCCDTDLNCFF